MPEHVPVVVIGGGQAGLAVSWHLSAAGVAHAVLERGSGPFEAWRTERWDSFCLVTPSWTVQLPGQPYDGDPDSFLTMPQFLAFADRWVASFNPPLRTGVEVETVRPSGGGGFELETNGGPLTAAAVVVATATHQRQRIPAIAERLPSTLPQLHTSEYKRPSALPPGGAVLVIGAGQSGCQVCEDLLRAGRAVYLARPSWANSSFALPALKPLYSVPYLARQASFVLGIF